MEQHPIKLSIEQQQWLNIYILRQRRITKEVINDLVFDGTVIFEQYMIFPFDPEEFVMRIIGGSVRRGYRLADACEARASHTMLHLGECLSHEAHEECGGISFHVVR